MGYTPMLTNLSRGGAAALLTIIVAVPLGAQSGAAAPTRVRDTSGVVEIRVMSKGRIDTIRTLMRSFEDARFGSPMWDSVRKQIEALMPTRLEFRRTTNPTMAPRGWIGIVTDGVPQAEDHRPDGVYHTYFAYPTIVTVDGQSPAQRAGILPGDVLVAYNGLDIVGRPFNLTQLLVPDRKLGVTVRREGTTKDFAVTVARATERVVNRRIGFSSDPDMLPPEFEREQVEAAFQRAQPGGRVGTARIFTGPGAPAEFGNRMFIISPNGVLGASVSTVGPALAKVLKLETGILVNDVPEETPASRSGLRAGDVIINVAGQPVASLNQLRELVVMRANDRAVPLRIIREKKQQDITVKW
jgi:membrane-associated protease RseP (regulator of RpoE activity)